MMRTKGGIVQRRANACVGEAEELASERQAVARLTWDVLEESPRA